MQWNNLLQLNPLQGSRMITNTLLPRMHKKSDQLVSTILPQQREQKSYLSNLLVVKQIPIERLFFPVTNRRKQIILPVQQQTQVQSVLNQDLVKEEEQERKIMINYLAYQSNGFITTSVGEIIRIENTHDGLNFKIAKLTKFDRLLTCNNEFYCGIYYIDGSSLLQFFDVSQQYSNIDEYSILLPNIMIVRRHDDYIFAVNNVGGLLFQQLGQQNNQYLFQTSREVSSFIRAQLTDQSFVSLSLCRMIASSFQRLPFVFITLQTDLANSYFRQILIYQNNIYVELVDNQLNEISGIILHRWNPTNGRMIAQKASKISAAAALDTELIILGYNNSYIEFYFTGFRSRNNFKTPMSSMQVGSKPINCILLLECDQKGLICCITCKDDNLIHLIQIFPNKKLATLMFQTTKMQYIRQIIPISSEYSNKLLIVTAKNKYFLINLLDSDNQNYFVRPFQKLDNDILLLRLGTGQELTVFEQSRLINLVLFGKLYRENALNQISEIRSSKMFSEIEVAQLLDNYRFYVGILQGLKLNYFGAIKLLDNYTYNPLEDQGDYLSQELLEQFLLNNSGAYLIVTKRRAEMKQLEKAWLNYETNQQFDQMNNSSSQNKSNSSKIENRSKLVSMEIDNSQKNVSSKQYSTGAKYNQQRSMSPTKVPSVKVRTTESRNGKLQQQNQTKYMQEQSRQINDIQTSKEQLGTVNTSQSSKISNQTKIIGQEADLVGDQQLLPNNKIASVTTQPEPQCFYENSKQSIDKKTVNQTDYNLHNKNEISETNSQDIVQSEQDEQLLQKQDEAYSSIIHEQKTSGNQYQQPIKNNVQHEVEDTNILGQKIEHQGYTQISKQQEQHLQDSNLLQYEPQNNIVDPIRNSDMIQNQGDHNSQTAKEIPNKISSKVQDLTGSEDTLSLNTKAQHESPAADDTLSNQPLGLFNANQLDMSTYNVGFTFGFKPPVIVVNNRIQRSYSDDQLIQGQRYKTQDIQLNGNINDCVQYPDQNRLFDKIVDELSKSINKKQYKATCNINNDVKLYQRDQQTNNQIIEDQILSEQKQHFMDDIVEIDIFEDDLQRINDDLIKMNRFIQNSKNISPDFQLESLDLRPGFLLGGPYMLSAMPIVLHHDSQLNDNIEDFGMSFIQLLQPALQGMFTDSKFLMFDPQSFPNTNDYWLDIYDKEHLVPVNMIYFRRIFTEYYQSHFTKQFHEKMKILANKNISISYQQIHMYPFSLIWAYLLYYQARQIFEFTKIGINQFENPYFYQLFYPGFDLLKKYDKFAGSLFSQSISQYFYSKVQYLLYFFRGLPNTIKKYAFERGRVVIERALEKVDARKTDGELLKQYRSIQISTLQVSKLQELMIFGDLQQKEIQKFSINFENRLLRPMLFFQRNHASLLFDISDIKNINYLQFFDQRQVRSMQLHADIQNQLVCSLLGKLVNQEFVTNINNKCEVFSSLGIMNQPEAIIQFIPIQLVFQFAIAHESLKPKQYHYNIFVEFITYFNITGTMLVYQLEKILNRLLPTFKQEWYYKILFDVVMLELNIKASRNVFMNFNDEFIKISDQDQTIIEDYCNSTFNDSFQSQLGNLSCNDFLMQNSFEQYLPISQHINVVEDQLNLSHCIHQLTIILNKSEQNVQQQIIDYYNNYDITNNSQSLKSFEITFQDIVQSQIQQSTDEQELNRDEKHLQKVKLLIQLGNLLQTYQTSYIINKDLGVQQTSTQSKVQLDLIQLDKLVSGQMMEKSNQSDLLQSTQIIDSPQNINFWMTQVSQQINKQKQQKDSYLSRNRQHPDGQLLGAQRQMEVAQVNEIVVNKFLKQEFRNVPILKSIKK